MNRLMFWITYWLAAFYLKVFKGLKVYGRENIPKKGALIIASNHASNLDPLVLGVANTRITRFMAKKELFNFPPLGWFIRKIGAFPVDRGKADMEAMRTSLKILAKEEVLGVFPEGTRNASGPGSAQLGIVMLALKAKVPVLPCGLINTIKGRKPIIVRIGKPIFLTEYHNRKVSKKEMEKIGKLIMGKISEQLSLSV